MPARGRLVLPPLVAGLAGLLLATAVVSPAHATDRAATFLTYSAFPQVGAEITVFGEVTSTPEGSAVQIQELRGETWTSIATVSTDDDGGFTHSFAPTTAGKVRFRAVAPAAGELAEATSAERTLAVFGEPTTRFTSAPIPKVAGSHTVGSVLAVDSAPWSPQPSAYKFQWIRDGKPIPAYGFKYRLTADDLGKHMTVVVGGSLSGAMTLRESKPAEPVERGTFATHAPTITGTVEVGQTVRAEVAGWSPEPATLTFQWKRDGTPIIAARDAEYVISESDSGRELSVEVTGESPGIETATLTSAAVVVPGEATSSETTFGDLMSPRSTDVISASEATYTATHDRPSWGMNKLTRWDTPGAFRHSLTPKPYGTLYSAFFGNDFVSPSTGAEYVATNSTFKNADVEFDVTATRFALHYVTYGESDAMVWIDDKPISDTPIEGYGGTTKRGYHNWITVTLPARKTVNVRFAGPLVFTGVDTPRSDDAVIRAPGDRFTLGVISDSYFEPCYAENCLSRSAAPMLSTFTGFTVRNLAEASTGYINDGSGLFANQTGAGSGLQGHESSAFGSERRIEAITSAPMDALLVNGSANDQTVWTPEQHRAAVDAFLSELERVRPDLPVVLVGVQGIYYTRRHWRYAHYKALNDNLAAMVQKHPNVAGFIDGFTDPWFTGTGSTEAPQGDGNQDLYIEGDGHPNGDGQAYFQSRIAEELKKLALPAAATP